MLLGFWLGTARWRHLGCPRPAVQLPAVRCAAPATLSRFQTINTRPDTSAPILWKKFDMDKLRTAVDTKDRVAAHGSDHDEFSHHVREAPVVEAVAELTDVDPQFASASPPNRGQLQAALDVKDRLAAHGMRLPEAEAVWREELEEAVREVASS